MLGAPIQLPENEIAIKQLACDKTPGPDGFLIDFYKKFLPELKHLLHAMFIESDFNGEAWKKPTENQWVASAYNAKLTL